VCKKSITNSQLFVKKMKKCQVPCGGIFFDSHCIHHWKIHFMGYNYVPDITGLSSFV